MHNLKEIRKDFEAFKKSLKKDLQALKLINLKIWMKKIENLFKRKSL